MGEKLRLFGRRIGCSSPTPERKRNGQATRHHILTICGMQTCLSDCLIIYRLAYIQMHSDTYVLYMRVKLWAFSHREKQTAKLYLMVYDAV
jgi:hypothetical protein